MKTKISRFPALSIAVAAMLAVLNAQPSTGLAQGARFFRISGPAATKITALRPDGSLVWTNNLIGTNYTVETLTVLPDKSNWVSYVQLHVTNHISTNQIVAFNPPAGMALIPAGWFTFGDTLDNETDAVPVSVTESGFYMDVNLVNGINAAYYTGSNPYTSPAGSFAANGYGLYDMAGNIWEWCWDWRGPAYTAGNDPRGPSTGTYRVMRGGDWFYYADYARCANRGDYNPDVATDHDGFRCVRGL